MDVASISTVTYGVEGARADLLDDLGTAVGLLLECAGLAGLTPVSSAHHRFEPQGISATVILSESHIAIHTWPESGTAYVTLTTCRRIDGAVVDEIGALIARSVGAGTVSGAVVSP